MSQAMDISLEIKKISMENTYYSRKTLVLSIIPEKQLFMLF